MASESNRLKSLSGCKDRDSINYRNATSEDMDDYFGSELVLDREFPISKLSALTLRRVKSKITMLRGTGDDWDKFIIIDIDNESGMASIKHYRVTSSRHIDVKSLPDGISVSLKDASYDELEFTTRLYDPTTGRSVVEIGPSIELKGNKVPKKVKIVDLDYESAEGTIKAKGKITTKDQELKIEATSDTLDTKAVLDIDSKNQSISLMSPFESISTDATLYYNQDKNAVLSLDNKSFEDYNVKASITNNKNATAGNVRVVKDKKLVVGLSGDSAGNYGVEVPTAFDLFMTDYAVDGVMKVSKTGISGSYALKDQDSEILRYTADHSFVSDYRKQTIQKNFNTDNGILGVKLMDIEGAATNSGIVNESSLWLNYQLKF